MTWAALLEQWALIECDLADVGVDVGDDVLMEARSWRWLQTRILGLFDRPTGADLLGNPIFSTRIQAHFAPKPDDASTRANG